MTFWVFLINVQLNTLLKISLGSRLMSPFIMCSSARVIHKDSLVFSGLYYHRYAISPICLSGFFISKLPKCHTVDIGIVLPCSFYCNSPTLGYCMSTMFPMSRSQHKSQSTSSGHLLPGLPALSAVAEVKHGSHAAYCLCRFFVPADSYKLFLLMSDLI